MSGSQQGSTSFINNPRVANIGDAAEPARCEVPPSSTSAAAGGDFIHLRLLVLGSHGVGKSAATVRYLTRRFIGEYKSQIDIVYKQRVFLKQQRIELEIIDVSTRPEEWTIPTIEMSQSDCYLIIYSIDNRSTLQYATHLLKALYKLKSCRRTQGVVTLIGNKKDLEHVRQVSTDEGSTTAELFGCEFAEISVAEKSDDIVTVFINLIHRTIVEKKNETLRHTRPPVEDYRRKHSRNTSKERKGRATKALGFLGSDDSSHCSCKDFDKVILKQKINCVYKSLEKSCETSINLTNVIDKENVSKTHKKKNKSACSFREPKNKKGHENLKLIINRSESLREPSRDKENLIKVKNSNIKDSAGQLPISCDCNNLLNNSRLKQSDRSINSTNNLKYNGNYASKHNKSKENVFNKNIDSKSNCNKKTDDVSKIKSPFLFRGRSFIFDDSKQKSMKNILVERSTSFKLNGTKTESDCPLKSKTTMSLKRMMTTRDKESQELLPKQNNPENDFKSKIDNLTHLQNKKLNSFEVATLPPMKSSDLRTSKDVYDSTKSSESSSCSTPSSASRQRKFSVFGFGRALGNILSKGSMPDLPRATANLYDKFGSLKKSIKKRSV